MIKRRALFLTVCSPVLAVAVAVLVSGSTRVLTPGVALAESPAASNGQGPRQPGPQATIAGRVITSDGSSVAGFTVVLRRLGEDMRGSGYRQVGPDGKFSFESLASGTYTLLAGDDVSQDIQADLDEEGNPVVHRPGDVVELLVKRDRPGVITGTVTGQSGEPIVEAIIQAIRVRDSDGNRIDSRVSLALNLQRKTDDRGVYRLWGLKPGSYVISAGGKSRGRTMLSAYDSDAPTYYVDSTSGSPKPVAVGPGEEVTGIDIQYRGGSGHKVSGVFSGSRQRSAQSGGQGDPEGKHVAAVLIDAVTGQQQIAGTDMPGAPPGSFEFSEIPDGEYEVSVVTFGGPGMGEPAFESRRITVKGADVTGIQLKAVALGTVSGRITVEPAADLKTGCPTKEAPKLDRAALSFSRAGQIRTVRPWDPFSNSSSIEVGIDREGNFPPTHLEAGAYRIKIHFPDESLYLNSITLGAPSKPGPLGPLFSIKQGQQLSTVIASLGRGAARLSGQIVHPAGEARMPAALSVYLVPAPAEAADNPLRFLMARATSSGRFVLANIPPGEYRILVRPGGRDSDQPDVDSTDGRAALRREAERTGVILDLAPCQRIEDFVLRYSGGQ